jgi:hypothetical protein
VGLGSCGTVHVPPAPFRSRGTTCIARRCSVNQSSIYLSRGGALVPLPNALSLEVSAPLFPTSARSLSTPQFAHRQNVQLHGVEDRLGGGACPPGQGCVLPLRSSRFLLVMGLSSPSPMAPAAAIALSAGVITTNQWVQFSVSTPAQAAVAWALEQVREQT